MEGFFMQLRAVIAGLLALNLSAVSFAQNFSTVENVEVDQLPTIDTELRTLTQNLFTRHKGNDLRPESCPLASTKNIDILSKIQTISSLLKDNCLDADQNRLDQILSGAASLQAELDKAAQTAAQSDLAAQAASASTAMSSATMNVGGTALNGQNIASLVGNINQIYKSRSCQSLLNNQTFLEKSAGVISDFAKVGLLVPNNYTLIIAGAGIALSSIMLMLNSLFDQRFDFANTTDRQSFIKLNCAFYDVRRDIEKSGFLEVATDAHREDFAKIEGAAKALATYQENLTKLMTETEKKLAALQTAYVEAGLGNMLTLEKKVTELVPVLAQDIKTHDQKLAVLDRLGKEHLTLAPLISEFTEGQFGEIQLLDRQLLMLLAQVDVTLDPASFERLMGLTPSNFKTEYMELVKFHFERVLKKLTSVRGDLAQNWQKSVRINELSYDDFQKKRAEEVSALTKDFQDQYNKVSQVQTRVKRILEQDGFTSRDDGSENIVNILIDYNKIVEQIYGRFGEKFLQYTTKTSRKENKGFNKKFKRFAKRYLVHEDEQGRQVLRVPNKDDISELDIKFACQDARPYRAKWKFAESLAQQGYDFVATNGDLFHSDIRRVFLGRSDNRPGIHNLKSRWEKIQMHYKSAVYAKKQLQGKPVDEETRKTYFKRKYIGRAILDVKQTQSQAQVLQDLIEKYECLSATALE
jgi:hypothetical protein